MRFARLIHAPICALALACVGAASSPTTQPSPTCVGLDGKLYRPLNVAPGRAAVLVFVLQDCPICNAYAPEIRRIRSEAGPKGARFYVLEVDPAISDADARKHAKDFGYTCPVLLDRHHALVNGLGVVAVPTAVVLGPDGEIRYRGRIDDRFFALGKSREAPTRHDLRDALDAVLAHRPVSKPRTRVVGCAVPDLLAPPARK